MKAPSDRTILIGTERESSSSQNRVLILNEAGTERILQSASPAAVYYTALSPNGNWLALGHYIGSTSVLDTRSGETIEKWPELQNAEIAFTPDGQWLVTGMGQEYQFWEVGTWQPGLQVKRATAGPLQGLMGFSKNGRLLAIIKGLNTIELLDWRTGQVVADLVPPQRQVTRAFGFSPDDSLFAAVGQNAMHLWDLRELRRELTALNLDWNQSPYPTSSNSIAKVVFRLGLDDPEQP